MQNQNNKLIKEGLSFGAIFIALLVFTLYIPMLEFVTFPLLTIPIAMYAYRYGWKASAIMGVILLFSISVFAINFFVISIPMSLVALLAGTFIGEALRSNSHPYEVWIRGTIGFALGFLVLLLTIEVLSEQSLATEFQLMIKESMDSTQLLLDQAGVEMATEDLNVIESQMMSMLDLIPGILVIVSMIYGLITQWLTQKVSNKWNKTALSFPAFRSFQLPKVTLWVYLLVMALSWFSFESMPMVEVVILNAMLILGVLFSIQGLSFIIYLLAKKKQRRFVSILVIVFLLVFLPLGMYLTRILGIIDVGFMLKRTIK